MRVMKAVRRSKLLRSLTRSSRRYGSRDQQGDHVASGVYFYRMQADDISGTRAMTLLK